MSAPAAEHTTTGQTVTEPAADSLHEADLLVEEVSIDGMCGVY